MPVPGPETKAEGEPGLVSGHVKLAQGIIENGIGGLTGSENWKQSGESIKAVGVSELKAYQEKHPSTGEGNSTLGRLEAVAGSAIGCEGMEEDGQKKI